jgi:hypothetical protein
MKNWTEFLPKRTNELRRKGKMLNAIEFELIEARLRNQYLLIAYTKLELSIKDEAIKFNKAEEIENAIAKSIEYNSNPIEK